MRLLFLNRFMCNFPDIEKFVILKPILILPLELNVEDATYYKLFYCEEFFKRANEEQILAFLESLKDEFYYEFYKKLKEQYDFYVKNVKNKKWTQRGNQMTIIKNSTFNRVKVYYTEMYKEMVDLTYSRTMLEILLKKKYNFILKPDFQETVSDEISGQMVSKFVEYLIENIYTHVFSNGIEKKFKFGQITDADTNLKDEMFFSTDLIRFPLLHDINTEQFEKIITDITTTVMELGYEYEIMNQNISNMTYGDKNMLKTVNDLVLQYSSKLQSSLDSNIFIQKQYNSYSPKDVMNVRLGITSYNNLLEMYVWQKILSEGEMLGIKEKLGKNIDLNKCIMILYTKLPDGIENFYKEYSEKYISLKEINKENK